MAYRHYETLGFLLVSRPLNEAGRLYQIFTPDFGLIRVLAQGVRLEKSKLRYNLVDYSLITFNLVRGREYWRLTGAEKVGEANTSQTSFIQKIGLVLTRLIHGEEAKEKIFADLKQAWQLLAEKGETENLEIFVLIRILADLGYLAESDETKDILGVNNFSWSDISKISSRKLALIRLINLALTASGL